MLRIDSLALHNFGPFKGTQIVRFPSEDGVTIIYGGTGRGKTKLLNAIRYALFGKVVTRGSRIIDLSAIGNWEASQQGEHGFKVVLEYRHDRDQYELTRACHLRSGVTTPTSEADFVQEVFLQRNGHTLSPNDCSSSLASVMPENIARFFLFDGELLQEYETLLHESTEGQAITASIERILGVPVLQNARTDMRLKYEEAQRTESLAAQRNQKTREIGQHLERQGVLRVHHEAEIKRHREAREGLASEKAELDSELRKVERYEGLLVERDHLAARIGEIAEKVEKKRVRLREHMSVAWREVIGRRVSVVHDQVVEELATLQRDATARKVGQHIADELKQSLSEGVCRTCSQELSSDANERIRLSLKELHSDSSDQLDEEIAELHRVKSTLGGFTARASLDVIGELVGELEELQIESTSKQGRIEEIDEAIGDINRKGIREARSRYGVVGEEIAAEERAIQEEGAILREIRERIRNLETQLERGGDEDLTQERRRRQLYENLESLFTSAVGVFRDRLRDRVETDASLLFRKLTTEEDYGGLRINENYGLSIVHKDGELITDRSSGVEQTVALSLIGALQKNAPLQGPIIMDSSFGRIDSGYRQSVVKALPSMAGQVILLVYRDELEPTLARGLLEGKLRSEYEMTRRSARFTVIEERSER